MHIQISSIQFHIVFYLSVMLPKDTWADNAIYFILNSAFLHIIPVFHHSMSEQDELIWVQLHHDATVS